MCGKRGGLVAAARVGVRADGSGNYSRRRLGGLLTRRTLPQHRGAGCGEGICLRGNKFMFRSEHGSVHMQPNPATLVLPYTAALTGVGTHLVWNPHNLCSRVWVIKDCSLSELAAGFAQLHYLRNQPKAEDSEYRNSNSKICRNLNSGCPGSIH